jgi:membrane protease YdiL (CAAX protease family)
MDDQGVSGNRRSWGWWIHLLLLTAYPVVLGIAGYLKVRGSHRPILPGSAGPLLLGAGLEICLFAVIFALACFASGARANDLLLQWRGSVRPVLLGFAYSIGLRLMIMAMVVVAVIAAALVGVDMAALKQTVTPEIRNIVSANALVNDPLYLALMLTVVSFVLAGLREELWRAGMFAAFRVLVPQAFTKARRWLVVAAAVALVFGIGHLTQGIGGVVVTTLLGFGLGAIIIHHNSIWEAVLAHGFFNATSFAMLYMLARYQPDALTAPVG